MGYIVNVWVPTHEITCYSVVVTLCVIISQHCFDCLCICQLCGCDSKNVYLFLFKASQFLKSTHLGRGVGTGYFFKSVTKKTLESKELLR